MKIQLREGLPYIIASLEYRDQRIELLNVLLDTGSRGSLFSTDRLLTIGLQYEPNDMVHRIRGVGGSEFVFTKQIGRLVLDELQVENFEIEVALVHEAQEVIGLS